MKNISVIIPAFNEEGNVNELTNSMIPKKFTKSIVSKVVLEENSDIGANTVILPGVTIGKGVALGANSLVLKYPLRASTE